MFNVFGLARGCFAIGLKNDAENLVKFCSGRDSNLIPSNPGSKFPKKTQPDFAAIPSYRCKRICRWTNSLHRIPLCVSQCLSSSISLSLLLIKTPYQDWEKEDEGEEEKEKKKKEKKREKTRALIIFFIITITKT